MVIAVLAAAPAEAKDLVHGSPWRAGDQFQLVLSLQAVRQVSGPAEVVCRHEAVASLTATKRGDGVAVVTRPVRWWTGTGIGDCDPLHLLHAVGQSFRVDETGDVSAVKLQPLPRAARALFSDWSAEDRRDTVENFWGGAFAMIHAAAITPIDGAKDGFLPALLMPLSQLTHDRQPCDDGLDRCARGLLKGRFEGTLGGKPVKWSTTEELLLDRQNRPARYRQRRVEPADGLTTTFEIRFRPVEPVRTRKKQ